jgi:hypothetical protein
MELAGIAAERSSDVGSNPRRNKAEHTMDRPTLEDD